MKVDPKQLFNNAVKELKKDLDNGYSERIVKYFQWKAKFYNYSFWNSVLIMIQNEDATFVKGFNQWKAMGYHVNKGAKAIRILAPTTSKYIERTQADGTKIKVYFRDMTELERKRTDSHIVVPWFKEVYVFDIQDTDCKERPSFFTKLGNNYETEFNKLINIFRSDTLKIEIKPKGSAEGYYSPIFNEIVVKQNDYNNMLLALLHEYAHYLCHTTIKDYKKTYSYSEGEVHAESVAFIVSRYIGMDNPFSKDYIKNWKGNTEKVNHHLSIIDDISTKMFNLIVKDETIKNKIAI
jgi:hypothetical protein